MNTRKSVLATLLAAAFLAPLADAPVQAQVQQQAPRYYSQAELDQMLAPIALYPDALLSQVLMAATYPAEVAEAAQWTRANGGLLGDAAVRSAQSEDWDPSVISLVAFPQILQRMDENPEWTRSLGDAFLAQESVVMDSVQQLRRRAQAAGNLQSSEQILVEQQGPTIVVQPASPQYVYVPYYDPLVVYGQWWWPSYRPVAWAPWPGYARPYRQGASAGFWWGQPVGLSVNFFFGGVDWRYRQVRVLHPAAYYYRAPVFVNRTVAVERNTWRHDPSHRRGVEYRAPEVRQRFAGAPAVQRVQPERREERRDERRPERREERAQPRVERQVAPVAAPVTARIAAPVAAPVAAPAPVQPRVRAQPEARPQPQVRQEQVRHEQRQERREQRPEQRARMPEAVAPQQPRAERPAPREERQERREQRREERGQKS